MTRTLWLGLLLLGVSMLRPLSFAHAQQAGLRGATLYLTASSSSTSTAAPLFVEQSAPRPYPIEAPSHHFRKGSYLVALGLGLLAGALTHAIILASVKRCGIERPNIIADVAIASVGLGISYGGLRQLQLAPLGQRTLSPLTKALGLPATAIGAMGTTLAFTGIGSFVTCFEVN